MKKNRLFLAIFILLLAALACGLPDGSGGDETAAAPTLAFPTATPVSGGGAPTPGVGGMRPWPNTTSGIHVFNDQIATVLSDAQWQFAATHYAGTQKMPLPEANRLRAINPDFLILHYRLGEGLGYQAVDEACLPNGEWLQIVVGPDWVQEWPGEYAVTETWFYHWPEDSETRVLNCDWGWYLVELNDPGWREWWQGEVLAQVRANDDDGVFMDSLSVPNFLGADRFVPSLPEVDADFEFAWAERITDWLAWLQTQPLGDYSIIPNVGSWITSRDTVDYTPADGVMIEGFAIELDQSPYALDDWILQMNRALEMTSREKVLIGQTYATGDQERMFALGSYLLIKSSHTYLNIDIDLTPEWWPEYDILIGAPLESAGVEIATLYDSTAGVYRRDFDNGFVLVNPTNPWDGTGSTAVVNLGGTFHLAQTRGGGDLPEDGIPTGTLTWQAVSQVTLQPFSAAVLLNAQPNP